MLKKSVSYLPALDGLRGISILFVLSAHFKLLKVGGFGVTIFFFISGLLITRLLITEFNKEHRIDLKNFFIRRVLRLYPPLLLFISVFCIYLLAVKEPIAIREIFASVFYFENYYYIYHQSDPLHFRITWSLSIEEHFYLFFPFIFALFIKKPKILLAVISAFAALSLAHRLYISHVYNLNSFAELYNYSATTCRADSILFGCITSVVLYLDKKEKYLKLISSIPVYIAGAALIIISLGYKDEFFSQTFKYTLQGLGLAILIPPIVYNEKYSLFAKILATNPLAFIGKLSYSLYLFHSFVITAANHFLTPESKIWYAVVVTGSFAFALGSYNLVEKPIMSLRRKYGSNVQKTAKEEEKPDGLTVEKTTVPTTISTTYLLPAEKEIVPGGVK
ncbi:acyltransferase family protein [Foetidibacter luteolus]|uniref:acyltransferase family protein n=1 Tax=Foetidibacter luteolus TaxID=2608880 RepID=UPI00129A16FA|nr:acyltransferase [Foetidibacter luteolus]